MAGMLDSVMGGGMKSAASGLPSFASSSSAGPSTSTGSATGTINFGGSGLGGTAVGGSGVNLGALVTQYWPLLLAAGVILYVRRKRAR
jgi:hypothetical protein